MNRSHQPTSSHPLTLIALTCISALFSACALSKKPIPCPVCYEDEWSREAFPGQQKQYIPPLDPASVRD